MRKNKFKIVHNKFDGVYDIHHIHDGKSIYRDRGYYTKKSAKKQLKKFEHSRKQLKKIRHGR